MAVSGGEARAGQGEGGGGWREGVEAGGDWGEGVEGAVGILAS